MQNSDEQFARSRASPYTAHVDASPIRQNGRLGQIDSSVLLVAAAGLLGLLLRSLSYYDIFLEDGQILLGVNDGYLHARRALYSFVNFPAALGFDRYVAYPDGAASTVPPLFDWATAGIARLFGNDQRSFEMVAVWVSPVAGALLAWPAYAIARLVSSRSVGVAAACCVAVLPLGILITKLGNFDHHAVVALIAACWLWVSLACVDRSGLKLAIASVLQSVVIAAMVFTWSGSLLYLAVGSGTQLAGILWWRARPEALVGLGASLAIVAAPTALWLIASGSPIGGAFSGQTLSWLHVVALLGIATPTLLLAFWEWRRPSTTRLTHFARFGALILLAGLPLLALSAIREPLMQGLGFLAEQDDWAGRNPEQLPLFHATTWAASATVRLGYFAYGLPLLVPYLCVFVARSREREKALLLMTWTCLLAMLLLSQVRYGTDFAVPGSVVLSLALRDLRRLIARTMSKRLANFAIAGLVAVALLPVITEFYQPLLVRSEKQFRAALRGEGSAIASSRKLALDFGNEVQEVTPPTQGFFETSEIPEYGILTPPRRGHVFVYTARRPVPANNMGPYLDREKYQLAKQFYSTLQAEQALEILDRLAVDYVVTMDFANTKLRAFSDFLHVFDDGFSQQHSSTGRFRLLLSSLPLRKWMWIDSGDSKRRKLPGYKLFEIVRGALIVVDAKPGTKVTAEIELRPHNAPAYTYRARVVADAHGKARLRVPYPTAQQGLVETGDAWWVHANGEVIPLRVSESDVLEGNDVRVIRAGR